MGSRLLAARHALISLVLVGSLAACGDDAEVAATTAPEPTAPTATEESSDPTSSPTALATAVPLPVMPREMANNDAAGAEAAARYFVDLINYSYANRDVEQFSSLVDEDCVFCEGVIDEVDRMLSEDVSREGGFLEVASGSSYEYFDATGAHFVTLEVREEAARFVDSDGAVLSQSVARSHMVDFVLSHADGVWTLLASGEAQ